LRRRTGRDAGLVYARGPGRSSSKKDVTATRIVQLQLRLDRTTETNGSCTQSKRVMRTAARLRSQLLLEDDGSRNSVRPGPESQRSSPREPDVAINCRCDPGTEPHSPCAETRLFKPAVFYEVRLRRKADDAHGRDILIRFRGASAGGRSRDEDRTNSRQGPQERPARAVLTATEEHDDKPARARLASLARIDCEGANVVGEGMLTAASRDAGSCNKSQVPECPVCETRLGKPVLVGFDRQLGLSERFFVRECPACELGVTDPRPSDAELDRHYPETYRAYRSPDGLLPSFVRAVRRMRSEFALRLGLLRYIARLDPGRLLDVGCGRGDLAAGFVRHGWQVDGLDVSSSAITSARAVGVAAITGTIDEAPWPGESFDAVLFSHSLEHVQDPRAALERAHKLLRPGGVLAVAVPDWGSRQRRIFRSRWYPLDLPRHLQHFGRNSLCSAVERAGFVVYVRRRSVSTFGLVGSLQYALFGRLITGGRAHRPTLAIVMSLYLPLSGIAWLIGPDTLFLTAVKPRR
jgi:SAM-dependent methyltransferase